MQEVKLSKKHLEFFVELKKLCKKYKVRNFMSSNSRTDQVCLGFNDDGEWCYFKYIEGEGMVISRTIDQKV
jgi:hypothetical protein